MPDAGPAHAAQLAPSAENSGIAGLPEGHNAVNIAIDSQNSLKIRQFAVILLDMGEFQDVARLAIDTQGQRTTLQRVDLGDAQRKGVDALIPEVDSFDRMDARIVYLGQIQILACGQRQRVKTAAAIDKPIGRVVDQTIVAGVTHQTVDTDTAVHVLNARSLIP